MAEKVASLYAEIGANTSGLEKGLANTKGGLKSAAKEMTTFGGVTKDTVKQLIGWTTAAGAAYKITGAVVDFMKSSVNDTLDYAKAVRDVARYTGTSTEESSKLLQVADDLQIETQTLKVGFRNLAQEGIQPNIANIKDLAAQYQALKSPVDKAQFAMKMFGARSGMELAKVLELTGDQIDNIAQSAEDLGLVLDTKAIQATEDYRLAVDQLNDSWKGLKTTIGMEIIPQLGGLAEGTGDLITAFKLAQKAAEAGKISIVDFFIGWMQTSSQAEVDQYINDLRDAATNFADSLGDLHHETRLVTEGIEEATPAFGTFQKVLSPLDQAIWKLGDNLNIVGAMSDVAMDGINNLADTMAEKQAAFLAFQKIMGYISDAEFEAGMQAIRQLDKLELLVNGTETGAVTASEFFDVLRDGKIDVAELNKVLGGIPNTLDISTNAVEIYGSTITNKIPSSTGILSDNAAMINGIADAWLRIPAIVETVYKVRYEGVVPKVAPGGEPGGQPRPGGQHGLDMIIPQGYPSDSYPIFASSGERVTITPQHKIGKEGGDTIIINNNSTGAAALTMAIIAQQHRARLTRGMGG